MIFILILVIGFILINMSLNLGQNLYSLIEYKMALNFWHPRYFKKAQLGGFSELYLKQLEQHCFPITHFACVRAYHRAKQIPI